MWIETGAVQVASWQGGKVDKTGLDTFEGREETAAGFATFTGAR